MPDLSPEQRAREGIDAMLTASGFAVQNYRQFNPGASRGIALREVPMTSGRCDYLLMIDRRAVGVVEAKREGSTLSTVASQSAWYGENLPDFLRTSGALPFYYESTGLETFFRDQRDPSPRSRRVDKAKAGTTFTPDQLGWLKLIRDHVATSLSIETDDLQLSPFNQLGGLGRAAQLFGAERLEGLLEELNEVLVV
jgi:type I restriction enzyme R subunit